MSATDHPLRQALWPLGLLYGAVATVRNHLFDRGIRSSSRVGATVVSIGNLTVGGTGKTPAAAWLCGLAAARGRTPGVLARGYGRAPGAELNDEGMMLARRLPGLLQVQDPDRVAGARRLIEAGADYVVLDDGFQHRRLARDLDLLCLDATRPFGNGQCLPAGPLREFRSGLRRAGLVLLTRAGGLEAAEIERHRERVRILARNPGLPVYACGHAPSEVVLRPGGGSEPPDWLRGRRVVLLSAIARPESFRRSVEGLGADVVGEHIHRDHHRYTAADLEAASETTRSREATLVTTEKDDVKLDEFDIERAVLRIDLRFLAGEPSPEELLL